MNIGDVVRYKSGDGLTRIYYGIIIEVRQSYTSPEMMMLVLFDDGDLDYENDWQLEKVDV